MVDWDAVQDAQLTGAAYTAWLHEWEARMKNLRRTVNAARKEKGLSNR